MTDQEQGSLSRRAARNLATTTKTSVQTIGVTPRYLLRLLPWVTVQAGTYRVNRRKAYGTDRLRVRVGLEEDPIGVTPDALRALPILASADQELLAAIASELKTESVERGATIMKEGEAGDKLYILAKGKVEILAETQSGQRSRIAVLGEGEYFGEAALLSGAARTASVEALTPCTFIVLERSNFERLIQRVPNMREQMEEVLRERAEQRKRTNAFGEVRAKTNLRVDDDEHEVVQGYVDYDDLPPEYPLTTIETILRIRTEVADLYNDPINQLQEQLRLTIEDIRERQEWEAINNPRFGLLHQPPPSMRVTPRGGAPTPDDMDELLSRVWEEPSFFLAHPRAIAAFGRECTRRGVPPPTINMLGAQMLTWRGVPIVPSDKLLVDGHRRPAEAGGKTGILLMRVGENRRGVVGLHQPGIPGEKLPSLSVRLMGINEKSIAEYLLTLYFNVAVLTQDALGVLENVEVGHYFDYDKFGR